MNDSARPDLTAALKPERFENIEAGVRWDLKPGPALTAAAYRTREELRAKPQHGGAARLAARGARVVGGEVLI